MAVVYADLRFVRSSPQTDVTHVHPYEDWDITYENVSSLREHEDRKDETPSKRKCLRGVFLSHYVTVILVLIFLTSLAVIIGLSTRLSQVSQNHQDITGRLEQLLEEHEDLNSSLTNNILLKDSAAQALDKVLRQTRMELEQTKDSLGKSQEQWKTTNQQLQKAMEEKGDIESTSKRLQDNLRNTENKLQAKQNELSSCENRLSLSNRQKGTYEQSLRQTRASLTDTSNKLKTTGNNLTKKENELSDLKRNLQQVQSDLQNAEQQKKNLSHQNQRLSDAEQCFYTSCAGVQDSPYSAQDKPKSGTGQEDEIVYCPGGWQQIGDNCYYFSSERKVRIDADSNCKNRGAALAKIEDNDSILKEYIGKSGESYWIGLHKADKKWQWSDKTIELAEMRDFQPNQYVACAKAAPHLVGQACATQLPWICQREADKCKFKMDVLHCFGEKIGVFGEKLLREDGL